MGLAPMTGPLGLSPDVEKSMMDMGLDPSNKEHAREALSQTDWAQQFEAQTGKHPADLGIYDEDAATKHLMTLGHMMNGPKQQLAQLSNGMTTKAGQDMAAARGEFDDVDKFNAQAQRTGARPYAQPTQQSSGMGFSRAPQTSAQQLQLQKLQEKQAREAARLKR